MVVLVTSPEEMIHDEPSSTNENSNSVLLPTLIIVSIAIVLAASGFYHVFHPTSQNVSLQTKPTETVDFEFTSTVDLVVYNAVVHTMDTNQPTVTGFAIKNGRFFEVGDGEQLRQKYPDSQHLNALSRPIIPGLIDSHAHLLGLGYSKLGADLTNASSLADVVAIVTNFITQNQLEEGTWVSGRGWDQTRWGGKFPTHHDIDEGLLGQYQIVLTRIDGHSIWVNQPAMDAAAPLPPDDPPGGKIIRDPDTGLPTGIFIDGAMDLITSQIPPPTPQQIKLALSLAINECKSSGLTTIHDAGSDVTNEVIRLYRNAIDSNEFDLRVYALLTATDPSNVELYCSQNSTFGPLLGYGDGKLTVRSVKFMIDGALGSRGAALLEDYSDDPGNQGILVLDPVKFASFVKIWATCGFQVCTHAIGDRGNKIVLDVYEQIHNSSVVNITAARFRIEHVQVVDQLDFKRFATYDLIASMQPTHATGDMAFAEDRLGPTRILSSYAWQSFVSLGVRLPFGSDFPVSEVAPLAGIYAAVTRQDKSGNPPGGWYPKQRVSRVQALKSFTIEGAYAAFQEHDVGSITAGKYGDFVVLSKDILDESLDPSVILQTDVVGTFLGGKLVYNNSKYSW